MKVINLWGGPGSGKSTTAAGLYYLMKINKFKVELVREFVKDLIWEDSLHLLKDQNFILMNQNKMLKRLEGKVDYVITDSPLLLSVYYADDEYLLKRPSFKDFVWEEFNSYNNINIMLDKDHSYESYGRLHNEEEANNISCDLENLLLCNNLEYYKYKTNINIANTIMNKIIELES